MMTPTSGYEGQSDLKCVWSRLTDINITRIIKIEDGHIYFTLFLIDLTSMIKTLSMFNNLTFKAQLYWAAHIDTIAIKI